MEQADQKGNKHLARQLELELQGLYMKYPRYRKNPYGDDY